ncbi:EF-hand calcium-binding domain-containing protein 11 isoform X2 [Notamacropus eugenii]|uniref:EF-hand calcium-binding domain-containing protein 11 isoform X2 n=2 Tax=Notamacropus eugenii TaxID=9315 RepID=UPI003B67762E
MFTSATRAWCTGLEVRPSDRRKWVKVFEACDEDKKGYLSREDLKVAVVMLFGYKPTKIEANSVMASINSNASGIYLEEFIKLMEKKKAAQLYQNEIRQIFTAFDRQYRGFLTLEDFKKAFKQVAPKLPERIVLEAFSLCLDPVGSQGESEAGDSAQPSLTCKSWHHLPDIRGMRDKQQHPNSHNVEVTLDSLRLCQWSSSCGRF